MDKDNLLKFLPLVSQLGWTMVGSIGAGFGLGYWIDKQLESSPLAAMIGLTLGVLSGFYVSYRIIIREIERP